MAKRTITTNLDPKGNNKRSLVVEINYPDDIPGLVAAYGDKIVYEKFTDAFDVALQAFVRTQMGKTGDKRMTDEQIRKAVGEWKPSSRNAADPAKKMETVLRITGGMSSADRLALIKQLQAEANPPKAGKK